MDNEIRNRLRRRAALALVLCAVLVLCGCASEQTIVKKVNEPRELVQTERLKPLTPGWGDAVMLDLAPDNQTALLWQDGQLLAYKGGKTADLGAKLEAEALEGASRRICWSLNSRYACVYAGADALLLDMEKQQAYNVGQVQTACFNADHVTLYYVRAEAGVSVFCRRRVAEGGAEEILLRVGDTLHGPMFRTTRSQYLVMGRERLICLEQAEAGQQWSVRVVADFAASGMRLCDFSYSAQTGLCIVSGDTDYGSMAFSVVSPDGKDFVIDQVSCFSPLGNSPATNLPATELSALADAKAYPVALQRVQLSPGGLYLLLWGRRADSGLHSLHLLNLDTGKLTEVELSTEQSDACWLDIDWCAGKTLLLGAQHGETMPVTVTGWDD